MTVIGKNTKLKDAIKNEEVLKLLEQYIPDFDVKSPYIKMGLPMTLKQIVSAPQAGVKLEAREALFKALYIGAHHFVNLMAERYCKVGHLLSVHFSQ